MDEPKPDEFDDTQEGKVITPLPPGRTHSSEGIVTPKPPLRFATEQQQRLNNLPEELKDDTDDF